MPPPQKCRPGPPLATPLHTYKLQYIQWYRCKRTPKSFDLSKIRAKSLKMRAKMAPNVVWFQKIAPNISRKTHEDLFGAHTKKGLHDLWSLWEKFCRQVPQNFSSKFRKILAKILRTPRNLPAPKPMYIYRFSNQNWMASRHKRNRKPFEQLNHDLQL